MSNEFFALDSEGGEPLWYLQILMTIKASGEKTGGAVGLLDFKTPAGQTPLHVHHKEDEGCYLLEGNVTCTGCASRPSATCCRSRSPPASRSFTSRWASRRRASSCRRQGRSWTPKSTR